MIAATGIQAVDGGSPSHDMTHAAHDLALHVTATAGQTGTLEFTPTSAGTYEIWCTIAGHLDAGMLGTLVVSAP